MDTVTVSEKFQIVIPKDIRMRMRIKPGEKIVMVEKNGKINLIPVGSIKDARGLSIGTVSDDVRDESERFD